MKPKRTKKNQKEPKRTKRKEEKRKENSNTGVHQ